MKLKIGWKIGEGGSVKIWEDKWILALVNEGMMLSNPLKVNNKLRVNYRISAKSKAWNLTSLNGLI